MKLYRTTIIMEMMGRKEDELRKLEREDREISRRREKIEREIAAEHRRRKLRLIITLSVVAVLIAIPLFSLLLKSCGKKEEDPPIAEKIEETVSDLIQGEEGKVELITESVLKGAVKDATLYTAVYPYNGVAPVYDEDGGGLKYYVSYKGTIKAGINSNNIRVELEEETNTIRILLPEIEIFEPSISGEFNYIFMDEKYNTGDTYNEAFTAATTDLTRRIKMGDLDALKQMATESAKLTERALVEPLVNQVDPDKHYKVEVIEYSGEENADEE